MKIAVYGGSFNPPHVGHGMVISWLLWTGQADQVWLLPTFSHPFSKELAPFEMRVRWCEQLIGDIHPARVETIERELPLPNYTIDTLDFLTKQHPDHRFRLVIGADLLQTTSKWRQWQRIMEDYPPHIVGREGYPALLDVPSFPGISSTEIRHAVQEGRSINGWIHHASHDEIVTAFQTS